MGAASPEGALEAALSEFRAGDLAAASSRLDALLAADPRNARALHLSGEVAARGGDLQAAAARLAKAAALSAAPDIRASLARVRWRQGDIVTASAAAGESLAARPGFVPAVVVSAFCDHARGDAEGFRRSLAATGLPDADPMVVEFAFQAIAEAVRDGRRVFARETAPRAAPPPSLTVVTCSIDEAKLSRCEKALAAALGRGFEHVRIRAPRSIAQAYNQALAHARTDAVLFVHDDVEVLSPRLDALLAASLARADVVGVAGTRQLSGPTLGWSGQGAMRGWLVHGGGATATWDFSALALHGGLQGGMQGLDGCFIAARTEAARAIGFDAERFDAFHLYDLDFSLRAARAGLAVSVDTDILVAHASRGRLGPAWEEQARRFNARFAPMGHTPARPSHFHAARLAGADEARRLHDELNGFCAALGTRAE